MLPAGTRLDTRGEVTAPLARAAWSSREQVESLQVTTSRFEGTFTPVRSGLYLLGLVSASGAPLSGDTVRLPIRIVPDSAPVVEIPVPGSDTLAPLSLEVPLVIDVQDDHSVTEVAVESRRISRFGLIDSARKESVPVPPERPDRAMLTFTLDLNRRGLLPGDTVRYFATARDNAPRGHVGRSREFVLRLPTMTEVRAAQRQAAVAVASSARFDHRREQTSGTANRRHCPGAASLRPARRKGRGVADLRRGAARPSGGEVAGGSGPAGRGARAIVGGATPECGGGGNNRFGVAAAARRDPRPAGAGAFTRAEGKAGRAAAGAQGSRCRAGQGSIGAAGRGSEAASGSARAEPRAVPARRARGRSGQPGSGIEGPGPGTATVEPAGRLGRQ